MICEECCQFYNEKVKCTCKGGQVSVKRLGLVNGCVVFIKNKRCKKECLEEDGICSEHLSLGISANEVFLEKIFGK